MQGRLLQPGVARTPAGARGPGALLRQGDRVPGPAPDDQSGGRRHRRRVGRGARRLARSDASCRSIRRRARPGSPVGSSADSSTSHFAGPAPCSIRYPTPVLAELGPRRPHRSRTGGSTYPATSTDVAPARRRLAFDEFLRLQLLLGPAPASTRGDVRRDPPPVRRRRPRRRRPVR